MESTYDMLLLHFWTLIYRYSLGDTSLNSSRLYNWISQSLDVYMKYKPNYNYKNNYSTWTHTYDNYLLCKILKKCLTLNYMKQNSDSSFRGFKYRWNLYDKIYVVTLHLFKKRRNLIFYKLENTKMLTVKIKIYRGFRLLFRTNSGAKHNYFSFEKLTPDTFKQFFMTYVSWTSNSSWVVTLLVVDMTR